MEPYYIEPRSFKEAMICKDSKKWKLTIDNEYDSLIKNKTWVLVKKSKNTKIVGCRWIYKLKEDVIGV